MPIVHAYDNDDVEKHREQNGPCLTKKLVQIEG